MSTARSRAIAAIIAKRIAANTRKRFSTLHADALQEIEMSNSNDVNEQSGSPRDSRNPGNTSGMSVGQNSAMSPVTVKPVDRRTLAGSTPGDFRAQAQGGTDSLKGNDTPPRGETANDENAGA